MEIVGIIIGVIVGVPMLLGTYLLPSICAFVRGHPSKAAILILNIFLGWTFIGWIVSLVWAFTDTRRA